jgi:putative methanogenesis marker protein 8
MEILGKARVVVKDGKVVEVGEPQIAWCPIFEKARGIREITLEEVKKNMEFRIRDFGLFTDKRKLEMDVFVGFGASEIMMTGLNKGLLDTTVTVCDGAGTVITNNPSLVQGMGARISGLVETEPIDATINGIEERGGIVLDPSAARIDPAGGVKRAAELGYRKIAVTVVFPETAKELRDIEQEMSIDLTIIGAHVTGINKEFATELVKYLDIVTTCASKHIREIVKPLAQVGTAVPLFAITPKGKELLLERAKEVESPILINTMALPALPEHKQPRELI